MRRDAQSAGQAGGALTGVNVGNQHWQGNRFFFRHLSQCLPKDRLQGQAGCVTSDDNRAFLGFFHYWLFRRNHVFGADNGIKLFFRYETATDSFFTQSGAVLVRRFGYRRGVVIADFRGQSRHQHKRAFH